MPSLQLPQDKITFFDIPFTCPGKALSPNTFITRYSLKIKGIPFHTQYIELADVQAHCKSLKVKPTMTLGNGQAFYTLPAIYDPSTGRAIAESYEITEYLDRTYPNTPRLIPEGTGPIQSACRSAIDASGPLLWPFLLPSTVAHMTTHSLHYYVSSREAFLGKRLEDLYPKGEEDKQAWGKVKNTFDIMDVWLQKGDGLYLAGKEPTYVDLFLAGKLFWIMRVLGEDSEKWNDVLSWHGGRWKRILESITNKYD